MTNENLPRALHLMVKPAGPVCNLACRYCFYICKDTLYPGSRFRMTNQLLESYIRQLIESHQTNDVTVSWQGGEPTLMGLDFFRRSIAIQRKYQKPYMKIQNTFQTNGVLLDDEWCEFFRRHGFLVGLSLDGPQQMHDAYRKDKQGNPSFERVRRGLNYLKQHNVDFNVLTTVHASNVDHPLEVYRFLRDEIESRFIQFIPMEHNGDVYACDHFVEEKYLLGNLNSSSMEKLIDSPSLRKFGQAKKEKLSQYCRDCDVLFACNGECPKNRFIQTPDGEFGLNYLCAGYKAFFHHIDRPMRIMAELLNRNEAPARIMQLIRKEGLMPAFVKAKRNEACPCNRGQKFKHCHGQID